MSALTSQLQELKKQQEELEKRIQEEKEREKKLNNLIDILKKQDERINNLEILIVNIFKETDNFKSNISIKYKQWFDGHIKKAGPNDEKVNLAPSELRIEFNKYHESYYGSHSFNKLLRKYYGPNCITKNPTNCYSIYSNAKMKERCLKGFVWIKEN